jgi:hypothetical protein
VNERKGRFKGVIENGKWELTDAMKITETNNK